AAALFEKAGGKASLAVAAEKTPEDAENRAQKAGEAAKIWWELAESFGQKRPEAMELFKGHAGVLYAEALEGGIYEGLAKVVAEKRVEEAAEYGAEQAASVSAPRSAAEVRRRPGKLVEVKPNLKVADNPNVMHFKDRKGVTWAYSIQNGEALLRGVFANNNVAQGDLSGEVRVPVTLGNCPVLAIPNEAFNKCEAMTHIVLPPGLKSIGVHAFQHTKALEEIVVPESVEVIGGGAFSGSGIRKIQLPANIVRCCVGSTFCNCKRLEAIDLPDGIEHIGVFEFVGSTSLRKVHFPKSLKSMHDWTFHNCDLEEVVLPSGVERVGHHAFSDNRNLKFLKIESENIRIDGDGNYRVVFDLPAGVPVYVTKRWKGPLGSIHGHTVKCVK
ncbi:MAG: leucine-rich repeat protein, partial [Kiritimatiellae bacterium]|nr:leucine-rich repeat protein [Kiritimatiellia bacterium]